MEFKCEVILPERKALPVDGINSLRNVNFSLGQSFHVGLGDVPGETKLTGDVRSEMEMESLLSLHVLDTEAGLVEGPGLGDVPGVVRVGPGSVEQETVRPPGQEEHRPGTGGDGEDPGQERTEDGGGECEDIEDGVEGPHTSCRGGGRQEEHEQTGENMEAGQGQENGEENVEDLLVVQDVVLVSLDEVEVDQQSDGQAVAGEDRQVEQRAGKQSFLHGLHLRGCLQLLSLILLLPADVLHHQDGGDGGQDPAGELVEPGRDVDQAEHEDGVQAQHRDDKESCVTVAWQQSLNMLPRRNYLIIIILSLILIS